MSLKAVFFVFIEYNTFKNIGLKKSGKYFIKAKIQKEVNPQLIFSFSNPITKNNRAKNQIVDTSTYENEPSYVDIIESEFYSRKFYICYKEEVVSLNEGCYFRVEIPMEDLGKMSCTIIFDLYCNEAIKENNSIIGFSPKPILKGSQTITIQQLGITTVFSYLPLIYTQDGFAEIRGLLMCSLLEIRYQPELEEGVIPTTFGEYMFGTAESISDLQGLYDLQKQSIFGCLRLSYNSIKQFISRIQQLSNSSEVSSSSSSNHIITPVGEGKEISASEKYKEEEDKDIYVDIESDITQHSGDEILLSPSKSYGSEEKDIDVDRHNNDDYSSDEDDNNNYDTINNNNNNYREDENDTLLTRNMSRSKDIQQPSISNSKEYSTIPTSTQSNNVSLSHMNRNSCSLECDNDFNIESVPQYIVPPSKSSLEYNSIEKFPSNEMNSSIPDLYNSTSSTVYQNTLPSLPNHIYNGQNKDNDLPSINIYNSHDSTDNENIESIQKRRTESFSMILLKDNEMDRIIEKNGTLFCRELAKGSSQLLDIWERFIDIIKDKISLLVGELEYEYNDHLTDTLGYYIYIDKCEEEDILSGDIGASPLTLNSYPILNSDFDKMDKCSIPLLMEQRCKHRNPSHLRICRNCLCSLPKYYENIHNPNNHDSMKTKYFHVVFFTHGLQAGAKDLRFLADCFSFIYPHLHLYLCKSCESISDKQIEIQGQEVAKEINDYLIKIRDEYGSLENLHISFIGHSIGGLVIKYALTLPILQSYIPCLYNYISFNTPHMGYLFAKPIKELGAKLLAIWNSCDVLEQLLFPGKEPRENVVYKLNENNVLSSFQHIYLSSCYQDDYIPFHSTRAEFPAGIVQTNTRDYIIYTEMIENFWRNIDPKRVKKFDFYFPDLENVIDDMLVRRKPHIAMLKNLYGIFMLLLRIQPNFD
ncbi:hypothetical protein WA158_000028 [Blastocystis sp. Blastoise]